MIKKVCAFLCVFFLAAEPSLASFRSASVCAGRSCASEEVGSGAVVKAAGDVLSVFLSRGSLEQGVGRGNSDLFAGKIQKVFEPITMTTAALAAWLGGSFFTGGVWTMIAAAVGFALGQKSVVDKG